METESGEHVEGFLAQTGEGSFHNVQLVGFGERREVFSRVKKELLSSVVASLQHRFQGVESHRVLLAASRLVDPREWPADQQELASYGSDHVNTVTEHFADVLDHMGCDRVKAKCIEWPSAKVIIKSLPQSLQQNAWQDFFVADDRRKTFCNLLLIVELILVMPLSTASVERGFSAMKRIKTDWRSNLSVNTLTQLLFISLEGLDLEDFNSMSVVDRWLKGLGVNTHTPFFPLTVLCDCVLRQMRSFLVSYY
ncbi:zinc finger protein 862-like [Larimichthys crocea]|uniref:zinc finger protein 862-like n=1 Tax=Larimichthys crocea TaxID=215358 RepID=UPI000F5F3777|nr:zinc finger protein 862-like [Larimichthys crocea]